MPRMHKPTRKKLSATPRWLRPKLNKEQLIELGLVHIVNHEAAASGQCTSSEVLYDYVHAVLAWSRVAETIDRGIEEMVVQLHLAKRLEERFAATGYLSYATPEDLELGAHGVMVMDAMAEHVDELTLDACIRWADSEMRSKLHWRQPLKAAA